MDAAEELVKALDARNPTDAIRVRLASELWVGRWGEGWDLKQILTEQGWLATTAAEGEMFHLTDEQFTVKIVDALGRVKAIIAPHAEIEDAIKKALVASGKDEAEGSLFRATIARFDRYLPNLKLAKKRLGNRWWKRNSRKVEQANVTCNARKGVLQQVLAARVDDHTPQFTG